MSKPIDTHFWVYRRTDYFVKGVKLAISISMPYKYSTGRNQVKGQRKFTNSRQVNYVEMKKLWIVL